MLEIENHDEIFNIINILKDKKFFENMDEAAEFGIGLKMFSEVIIRNKSNPVFKSFLPAFKEFMGDLKR